MQSGHAIWNPAGNLEAAWRLGNCRICDPSDCRHFVRLGRQHKRPLQAFFNLAPPVAAVLAAAAACLLVREAWVALRFWFQVSTCHRTGSDSSRVS